MFQPGTLAGIQGELHKHNDCIIFKASLKVIPWVKPFNRG